MQGAGVLKLTFIPKTIFLLMILGGTEVNQFIYIHLILEVKFVDDP